MNRMTLPATACQRICQSLVSSPDTVKQDHPLQRKKDVQITGFLYAEFKQSSKLSCDLPSFTIMSGTQEVILLSTSAFVCGKEHPQLPLLCLIFNMSLKTPINKYCCLKIKQSIPQCLLTTYTKIKICKIDKLNLVFVIN